MPDRAYFESKQLYNTIREYTEQIKRFNNQLHSLKLLPVPCKDTIRSIEKMKPVWKKEYPFWKRNWKFLYNNGSRTSIKALIASRD
ncbi:MAG: hypothetical protein GC171_06195 [Terrimonas sp.]|nr:hypothetical protein [Terrimonas sp.]